MLERDNECAILEYWDERVQTEIPRSDCVKYKCISTVTGGEFHEEHRGCHFRPFEPDCMAGEILPVDAEHPANARLIWFIRNSEYVARNPAPFSAAF